MKLDDFYQKAILEIAGNPAFRQRNSHGIYPDPHEWAERVILHANSLVDYAIGMFEFDKRKKPP